MAGICSKLSVIVPAYRQEKTIVKDLRRINRVLRQLKSDYEIICVVDGKNIDKTFSKAKNTKLKKLKVIGYPVNKGKGHAVRYGMERSKGDLVAFLDAGMEIHPEGLRLLLSHMEWYESDVIVGSVRHSASKVTGYPLIRKILSWGYHTMTKTLFGLKITDCQRGIKIFRREVLEDVLPKLLVKAYAFDIEMLSVAQRFGYTNIHDGPVEMDARKIKYSSVKAFTVWSMLRDTLAVFYRLKILKYYDK
jgi:glycosyltransferase involved in cell wall biosynthesis